MSSPASITPRGWTDRLSPILVKELRAMLRGRFLAVLLLATLSLVLAVTLWVVFKSHMEPARGMGPALFLGVYWTAHALIAVFPPLWAFTSLGQEFEDQSFELLALSRLSPWSIVVGKFLAALVQASAILCAVAPFAFFAFLFGGIDAWLVFGMLVGALASSAYSIALALAVSSLTHLRWARTLLMAGVFLWLAWTHGQALAYFRDISQIAGSFAGDGSLLWMLPNLGMIVLECGLLLAFAGGRLAHPEESRSTPLRAWCLVLVVATIVGATLALGLHADMEIIGFYVQRSWSIALAVLFLVATEPDALPRSWRPDPRSGFLARWGRVLLVAGGNRGTLLGLVLLSFAALYARSMGTSSSGLVSWRWIANEVVVFALPCICILLPAGLFAARNTSPRSTFRLRAGILLAWTMYWAVNALGWMLAGGAPDPGYPATNPLDPWYLVEELAGNTRGGFAVLHEGLLLLLVIATLIVNGPRMLRGAREVLGRRDAEAATGHPGAPHAPPQP